MVSACSRIICAIGHLNADNAMHAIENNSWLWCVWQPIYSMQILYRSIWKYIQFSQYIADGTHSHHSLYHLKVIIYET